MYMKQEELVELIQRRDNRVIVVDCRDDDMIGGKIKGSLNIPDSDWYKRSDALIKRIVNMAKYCYQASLKSSASTIASDASGDGGIGSFAASSSSEAGVNIGNRGDICAEVTVVLHCMESIRRGPRCARRLFLQLENLEEKLDLIVNLRVLEGGADRWVRKYFNNSDLVEEYDENYW